MGYDQLVIYAIRSNQINLLSYLAKKIDLNKVNIDDYEWGVLHQPHL